MISLQAEFYPVITAYAHKPSIVRFFHKNEPPGLHDARDWEIQVEKDKEFKSRALLTFAGTRFTPAHIEKTAQMLRQHEVQKARNPAFTARIPTEPVVYAATLQNAISIRNDNASLMDCFDIVSCAIGQYKPREASERTTHVLGRRIPYKGSALIRKMRQLDLHLINNSDPVPVSQHYESWKPD